MTDDDFQNLANLWKSTEPDINPETLSQTVLKAQRRSRQFAMFECVVAASMSLIITVIMICLNEPAIVATGAILLSGLMASVLYVLFLQKRLNYISSGDAETLLRADAERLKLNIRRYEAGLYAFLPAAFIGSLFGHFIADDDVRAEHLGQSLGWLAGIPLMAIGGLALLIVGAVSITLITREKTKLSRVESLLQNAISGN